MLRALFGPWGGDRSQSPPCCGHYLDLGWRSLWVTAMLWWALFEPWDGYRSQSPPCCDGHYLDLGVVIALSHHHVVGIIRTLRWRSLSVTTILSWALFRPLGRDRFHSHHVVGIIRTLGWKSFSVTTMLWALFGLWGGVRSQSPPCCGHYSHLGGGDCSQSHHVVDIFRTLGWRSLSVTAMLKKVDSVGKTNLVVHG